MSTPHLIDDIPALAPYQTALREIGYETLEEFVNVARVASRELSRYLKVESIDGLLTSIPIAANSIPQVAKDTMRTATYPLGVTIEKVPHLQVVPPIEVPQDLPATVDLRDDLPVVRDQGKRGTCVAHAALGAYEHYLAKNLGSETNLSEQFLYWNCKENDGEPTSSGTYLGIAFPALQRDGCCPEETWKYNPDPMPENEGQGPPPGGARRQALPYRISDYSELAPNSVADIKAELSNGRCVAFSIPVFSSWYDNDEVTWSGNIVNPLPGEVRVGGHAMCLVGYIDMGNKPALGGGRFILRNSWGEAWGINSPYGVGYGTIPYSYISRFCIEAYSIK